MLDDAFKLTIDRVFPNPHEGTACSPVMSRKLNDPPQTKENSSMSPSTVPSAGGIQIN